MAIFSINIAVESERFRGGSLLCQLLDFVLSLIFHLTHRVLFSWTEEIKIAVSGVNQFH